MNDVPADANEQPSNEDGPDSLSKVPKFPKRPSFRDSRAWKGLVQAESRPYTSRSFPLGASGASGSSTLPEVLLPYPPNYGSSRDPGFSDFSSRLLEDLLREHTDDSEIRKIVTDVQSFLVPKANEALAPFSLTIPNNVQYTFKNLNTSPESMAGIKRVYAQVVMSDSEPTVHIDGTALRKRAAKARVTLRDAVMETLVHELVHTAEKEDSELRAARESLIEEKRAIHASAKQALAAHVPRQMSVGGSSQQNDGKERLAIAQDLVRRSAHVDELAEVKNAAREGLGEYVMTKVMPSAVKERFTDREAWHREKLGGIYEDGLALVDALASHPEMGPAAVRHIMAAKARDAAAKVPNMHEVKYDLDSFTKRAYRVSTPGHTFDARFPERLKEEGIAALTTLVTDVQKKLEDPKYSDPETRPHSVQALGKALSDFMNNRGAPDADTSVTHSSNRTAGPSESRPGQSIY